jgi:AbrB family looped-hinge helix DNA binding protein
MMEVGYSHRWTKESMVAAVTVDSKGRFAIPAELRASLNIQPGDVFFIEGDAESQILRLAKAINPLDALADHAEDEFRAGRTRSLRDFAKAEGIDLDGED